MKIITDFKDYYDGVGNSFLNYSSDIVYRRFKEEKNDILLVETRDGYTRPQDIDYGVEGTGYYIGFCGSIYPCIQYYYSNVICYDGDRCFEFASTEYGKRFYRHSEYEKSFIARKIKDFFSFFEKYPQNILPLFEKYGPVFVIERYRGEYKELRLNEIACNIVRNPTLSKLGFASIKSPPEAYTSISDYLNNIAKPSKLIPELSNEDRIINAGFNPRTSFRNM